MEDKDTMGKKPSVDEDLEKTLEILLKNKELLENGIRREELKQRILQEKRQIDELQRIFKSKRKPSITFENLSLGISDADFLIEGGQGIPEENERCVSEDNQIISDQLEDDVFHENCDDVVPMKEATNKKEDEVHENCDDVKETVAKTDGQVIPEEKEPCVSEENQLISDKLGGQEILEENGRRVSEENQLISDQLDGQVIPEEKERRVSEENQLISDKLGGQEILEENGRRVSEENQLISDQLEQEVFHEHYDDVVPIEETADEQETSFTVAIDFGSKQSSYNALCHSGLLSADDINLNLDLLCSEDMETCILLDKDGKCDGIGENARRKYEDLVTTRRDGGFSFFWDFKKELITNLDMDANHVINDKNGDPVSAMTVMSAWLLEHKSLYLNVLLEQHGEKSKGYNVSWCITVPGSCTTAGKQFLTRAAHKAGMTDVKIVCDTEAAFFYFKHVCANVNTARELGESPFVIDVGARFLSFAAYKTLPNGTTREVGASGFVLDDTYDVRNVLWDILADAFGHNMITSYRAAYIAESEELEATWLEKVQTIRPEKYLLTSMIMKLHPTLISFIKSKVNDVSSRQDCTYVSVLGNILRVDLTTAHKKIRLLCDRMISKLRLKIGQTYITYERSILLCGGFPALHVLKEGIEQNFKGTEATVIANPKSAVPVGASFINIQT